MWCDDVGVDQLLVDELLHRLDQPERDELTLGSDLLTLAGDEVALHELQQLGAAESPDLASELAQIETR